MSDNTTPLQPYLLRALYQWMEDNGLTPQLLVDVSVEGVQAPVELAKDNIIQFNVSSSAVRGLELGNEYVSFNARFSGQAMDIFVPIVAVLGIFARENGQGMVFNESVQNVPADAEGDANKQSDTSPDSKPTGSDKPGKPTLKIIK